MEETYEKRYCNQCNRETLHLVEEDALAIDYYCQDCHQQEEVVKTFF